MNFVSYRPGAISADIMARGLRASDLPQPTTNAQATKTTQDKVNANHRVLARMGGFADGAATASPAVVADATGAPVTAVVGGAEVAQDMATQGAAFGQSIVTGVVTIIAATFALRLVDGIFGGRR